MAISVERITAIERSQSRRGTITDMYRDADNASLAHPEFAPSAGNIWASKYVHVPTNGWDHARYRH